MVRVKTLHKHLGAFAVPVLHAMQPFRRGRNNRVLMAERLARIRAGPPVRVEPSALARRERRSVDNPTIVLSAFSIQVNTLWRPLNLYEQQHLEQRLRQTLLNVMGAPNNIQNFLQYHWPQHRGRLAPGDLLESARFFYAVETGNPQSTGFRVHAHTQLWFSHRSNIGIDVPMLNLLLTDEWDRLSDGSDLAQLFMNRVRNADGTINPERRNFNVFARFIRVSDETWTWFYQHKNLGGLNARLASQEAPDPRFAL